MINNTYFGKNVVFCFLNWDIKKHLKNLGKNQAVCFGALQDSLIAKPKPTHPVIPFSTIKGKIKDPLKRVYKETTYTFFYDTFCLKAFFSSHKNHSKSPKNFIPEKPLHNPKLNPNPHSCNTPFLTQKSITGINIYVIFVLF